MEMPNLPTDNLYKFLAMFGLIILIFSSYMFIQEPEKLYSDIDKLQVREQLVKIQNQNDSLVARQRDLKTKNEYLQDSLELVTSLNGLQRKVDKLPGRLNIYIILYFFGGGISIIGFLLWFSKTQKFNDEIIKNESKKILNDKSVVIHKVQFEKEFNIYSELWANLILLRNATQSLRPGFESYDKSQSIEERKKIKIQDFFDSFNKCVISYENNKPFYPENIYKEIESVLKTSRKEAIEFEMMSPIESDYFKNAENNMDEIIEKIDIICIKIRDRIGLLKAGD